MPMYKTFLVVGHVVQGYVVQHRAKDGNNARQQALKQFKPTLTQLQMNYPKVEAYLCTVNVGEYKSLGPLYTFK